MSEGVFFSSAFFVVNPAIKVIGPGTKRVSKHMKRIKPHMRLTFICVLSPSPTSRRQHALGDANPVSDVSIVRRQIVCSVRTDTWCVYWPQHTFSDLFAVF